MNDMKICVHLRLAIAFAAVVFIATSAVCRGANNTVLEKEVGEVAMLHSEDSYDWMPGWGWNAYIERREALVQKAKKDAAPFIELRKATVDWRVRLLCNIVLERVQKEKAVAKFLVWKIPKEYDPGREMKIGVKLAPVGKDTPYLLTEGLWKQIGGNHWSAGDHLTKAIMACALGELRFADAREVLEERLSDQHLTTLGMQCSRALAKLKDPRSVPALINYVEQHPGAASVDTISKALWECATKESLPFLDEKLKAMKDRSARDAIQSVIEKFRPTPEKPVKDIMGGKDVSKEVIWEK